MTSLDYDEEVIYLKLSTPIINYRELYPELAAKSTSYFRLEFENPAIKANKCRFSV